jgi:hypothetical protein
MNKHIKLVHRGYRVVIDALKEEYGWSDLNKLTKDVIKNCVECKNIMPKRIKKSNSLHVFKEKKSSQCTLFFRLLSTTLFLV